MDYKILSSHFAEVSAMLLSIDREEITRSITILHEAKEHGARVWIVGNGGSAATAAHFANDLTKMAKIKAFAVADMTPVVTAFGNDDGWENMFSNALKVYYEPGDVVVAISCSGESRNVVEAARYMENLIVLTGKEFKRNTLVRLFTQSVIAVLHGDITVVEDVHMAVCHAIAKSLR